jgi:hypothetical protein
MKRAGVASIAFLTLITAARADVVGHQLYYDLIRPGGHNRGQGPFDAARQFCDQQTGQAPGTPDPDSSAYRKCMLSQHYKWLSVNYTTPPSLPASVTYNRDSPNPAVGWHTLGGVRVCHNDCENKEIPGSGYTCSNVVWLGMATRKCEKQN